MKEFVEKLIGRLEEEIEIEEGIEKGKSEGNPISHQYASNCLKQFRRYINQLTEEYNNGWIPCNERMPDKSGKYLVTVKNLTGFWLLENDVFVCDFAYDAFIFQGWEDNNVIAWMPLPEPYKEIKK